MSNFIEVKNVSKIYRIGTEKTLALDNVDLSIEKGEVCCLLGTSGSGKTTLLNLMAGLEKPTRGEIKINGVNVEKLNEKQLATFRQKNMGFVFQSYNLMQSMNALENVCLPLVFRGMSRSIREKAGIQMLKAVGLEKRMKHRPNQMSGGQQQRVGIARAFIAKPSIVFADEPTGNLDSRTTAEIMSLMLKMAQENNQTLVIVTHDNKIAEYADRIVYILDGNIQKIEKINKKVEFA